MHFALRLLAVFASVCLSVAAMAQTPRDIIAAADKVRNPGQPFRSVEFLANQFAI